jgi:hypothetical protein
MQSTDHQSVYINFIPGVSEKGRGYWKINNSILQEVEYQLLIDNLIDKYIVLSISPCSLITLLFSSSNLLIDFLTCLCFSKPKKYELFFSPNSTHFSLDLICAPFVGRSKNRN